MFLCFYVSMFLKDIPALMHTRF